MDLSYSTINIFPIPIHCFDVNDFSEIQNQLTDYCYNLREKDPVGNFVSNMGGWQSKPTYKDYDNISSNPYLFSNSCNSHLFSNC